MPPMLMVVPTATPPPETFELPTNSKPPLWMNVPLALPKTSWFPPFRTSVSSAVPPKSTCTTSPLWTNRPLLVCPDETSASRIVTSVPAGSTEPPFATNADWPEPIVVTHVSQIQSPNSRSTLRSERAMSASLFDRSGPKIVLRHFFQGPFSPWNAGAADPHLSQISRRHGWPKILRTPIEKFDRLTTAATDGHVN
jgi:hypothetical protein